MNGGGGGSRRARRYIPRSYKRKARAYKRLRRSQYYFRDNYAKRGSQTSKAMFGEDWKSANDEQKALRRAFRYKGAGEYYGDGGYWGDTIKPWLQRNIPTGTFASLGETYAGPLGKWAGSKLANYAGFGDYSANQLIDNATPTQVSVNSSSKEQDLFVEHTEFISNIYGSYNFASQSFILNAAHSTTFPWLSQIAKLYELYEFQGLIFQFKPMSIEAGTYTTVGKVIMATAYDPLFTGFQSSIQMENYAYANSTKMTEGLLHGVETAPSQKPVNLLYARQNNSIEGTRSADLSDLGTLIIATEGATSPGSLVGELWVSYRCRLSRPVFIQASASVQSTILADGYISGAGWQNTVPLTSFSDPWRLTKTDWTVAATRKTTTLQANSLPTGCYRIQITQIVQTAVGACPVKVNVGSTRYALDSTGAIVNANTGTLKNARHAHSHYLNASWTPNTNVLGSQDTTAATANEIWSFLDIVVNFTQTNLFRGIQLNFYIDQSTAVAISATSQLDSAVITPITASEYAQLASWMGNEVTT